MKTDELTQEKRDEWKSKNDLNWYLVDYEDGDTLLVHSSGLSNILQCGHDPIEYGILKIEQCGQD
jgi:hypothetical protein